MSDLSAAASAFLDAHHAEQPVVLANVWDVASARVVEATGARFIATSSHAIADVLGETDDDSTDPDLIFSFIGRIARAVDCPVTADLEAGYRLAPGELVERMLSAGVIGCNLEDTDHHGPDVLVDAQAQAGFLAEVRAAAEAAGVHIVINARTDTFIRRVGDDAHQLEEAIRRGRLYLEAGADCVYPMALGDRDKIAAIVDALKAPINVLARPGAVAISELSGLGVHRASLASGLHRRSIDAARTLAEAVAAGRDLEGA